MPNLPAVVGFVSIATSISSAVRLTDIAICFGKFLALGPDQKLFPHFCKARTAIFAVKQVEYGGHDRTSLFFTESLDAHEMSQITVPPR